MVIIGRIKNTLKQNHVFEHKLLKQLKTANLILI